MRNSDLSPATKPRQEGASPSTAPDGVFEVESTLLAAGQAFVVTRRVDTGGAYRLGPDSTLGGARVVECLDLPAGVEGAPTRHLDRTVFCLADAEDLEGFVEGARVELRLG